MKAKAATASKPQMVSAELAESLLLCAYLMLIVVSALVPSDTRASEGIFVVQAMLWTALGVAFFAVRFGSRRYLSMNRVDLLACGYLAWTFLATICVRGVGDIRAAINSFFQTVAFVLAILIGRQLLRGKREQRDVVALLLSLATGLAALGMVEYVAIKPAERAWLRDHEAEVLATQGIVAGSAEADRYLDRAYSKEPLSTFALTNSLASYLTPWIILATSLLATAWNQKRSSRESLAVAVALIIMVACLLLTKSRTAALAVVAGIGLLAASRLRIGERLAWHWWLIGSATVGLLAIAIYSSGGLDRAVLTEAPTSILYRLQYWQSTAAMIREHWLLGCGPGNFQSVYTFFKLPEASEEISDPHNFLLEVWSTVGTPGIVLLIVMLFSALRSPSIADAPTAAEQVERTDFQRSQPVWILSAAALGVVLSAPLSLLAGLDGSFIPVFIVLPCVVGGYLLLLPLVTAGLERGIFLPLCVITMLLNLLSAGGISFPNVSLLLAALVALCSLIPHAQSHDQAVRVPEHTSQDGLSASKYWSAAMLTLSLALMLGCLGTCYWPVVRSKALALKAADLASEGLSAQVVAKLEQAAKIDPWNPQFPLDLGTYQLQLAMASGRSAEIVAGEEALEEAVRRNPRSYSLRERVADSYLAAYRATGKRELLTKAAQHYVAAAARYPNFAVLHARLAWVEHVAKNDAAAQIEASNALAMDAVCPHKDKKLEKYRVNDPGAPRGEQDMPLDELMKQLAAG